MSIYLSEIMLQTTKEITKKKSNIENAKKVSKCHQFRNYMSYLKLIVFYWIVHGFHCSYSWFDDSKQSNVCSVLTLRIDFWLYEILDRAILSEFHFHSHLYVSIYKIISTCKWGRNTWRTKCLSLSFFLR